MTQGFISGWAAAIAGAKQQRALDVIDLFSQRETRDELGIGSIRDALADLYFPGTSTIQTRARYFLFIPWIYQRLESLSLEPREVAERLRREELRLMQELARSSDPAGTIGLVAGRSVKRLPSSVYWQGLRVLGIRLFPGSMERYHST